MSAVLLPLLAGHGRFFLPRLRLRPKGDILDPRVSRCCNYGKSSGCLG